MSGVVAGGVPPGPAAATTITFPVLGALPSC